VKSLQGKDISISDPLPLIPGLTYLGKSHPEVSEGFLTLADCPMRTEQILAGLENNGFNVEGVANKSEVDLVGSQSDG
jgi:hypothetical protein